MERLFIPKNAQEVELVHIIKTNKDKAARRKALSQLLVLNGFDKNEVYAIRSIETYRRMPGKPATWQRFFSATVYYDDCRLKR
jgi:hypothetical protein